MADEYNEAVGVPLAYEMCIRDSALGGLQHPRSIDRLAALPSTTKVLLAFDADEAGDKGRTRIGDALAKGPQVKHVRPGPDVKDWPDIVQARRCV